jgi:hypothetical protein
MLFDTKNLSLEVEKLKQKDHKQDKQIKTILEVIQGLIKCEEKDEQPLGFRLE